jgi:hypothetical protein
MNTDGVVTITNSTISENTGPNTGGIQSATGITIVNSILGDNNGGNQNDCGGPIVSDGYNLIGDPNGCEIVLKPTDLTGEPGLAGFTDNGTPGNAHFPLLASSQAIDSGNDDVCPPTDQLGSPRVDGEGDSVIVCDIGAIEAQIEVAINIHPKVLNLKSKGKIINSWIKLPEEYDPHDIARDSLELSIPSCSDCEVIYPICGFPLRRRYIAFFPQRYLIDKIKIINLDFPSKLDLRITGKLDDGTPFEGLDTIWITIKRKNGKKENKQREARSAMALPFLY